jgi:flagellar hook-associated protein FlgK
MVAAQSAYAAAARVLSAMDEMLQVLILRTEAR